MFNLKNSIVALTLGVTVLFSSTNLVSANATTGNNNNYNVNTIVATYSSNIVLLSDIVPYLPHLKSGQSYTNAQYKSAIKDYVGNVLAKQWTQKAKENIQVTDNDVTNAIYDIAARNGITYNQLITSLAYQGLSLPQYRLKLKNEIIKAQTVRYISSNINPKQKYEDIQKSAFFEYQKDLKDNKVKDVKVPALSIIKISTNPLVDGSQAKQKIYSIYNDIKSHKISFALAANKYSTNIISAANNGKIESLTIFQPAVAEQLKQQALPLKLNAISKPFYIKNFGWSIIQLNGYTTAKATLIDYTRAKEEAFNRSLTSSKSLQNFLVNSTVINYLPINEKALTLK